MILAAFYISCYVYCYMKYSADENSEVGTVMGYNENTP